MTANDDLDKQLTAFLRDGPTDLPDPSFDAVRDRTESTRQRVVLGPWRVPDTNKFLAVGLGTAAVVAVLLIGSNLLGGGSPPPGGEGPESAPPTETPASVEPTEQVPSVAPTYGPLPEGRYVLVYEQLFGVRTTVTIPAPDWYGRPTVTVVAKHGVAEAPEGAELRVFGGPMLVYGDPCAWESTTPDDPPASLDELAAQLAAQASRDAAPVVDVTVGGYPGKMLTLHVPDDAVFADCDSGEFRTLAEVRTQDAHVNQGPGQVSEVWVVDVDGTFVYFDAGYFAGTPAEYVEEMRAMVESATFE